MNRTVTVTHDSEGRARALRHPAFLVRVVRGVDRRKERRSTQKVIVGSSPDADLSLSDPHVSAMHCELTIGMDGLTVRDLGAKNGVFLAERRVERAWLVDGDEIAVGETVIRVQLLEDVEERALARDVEFGGLRGSSLRMRQLYTELRAAAQGDATVLIQGETGTGKELAAEALVQHGPRRACPLVIVDCGRLPPTLAESELFGHERGSFTGASSRFIGAFERAHGGTLFLDEIGELALDLQSRLLGVLERRSLQRVGGTEVVSLDVRVIAATHRDLAREVNRGTFRADLYYRLAVITITTPSLREHPEDIPELVGAFLQEIKGGRLGPRDFERLSQRDYPGNVRELRNNVERLALGLELETARPLPMSISLDEPFRVQKERLLNSFERTYLERLLKECAGNVSEAARRSGLSRMHVHELIRRLQVRSPA